MKTNLMKTIFSICIFIFCITNVSNAWNGAGHRIVAAIAYYSLKKENPAALARAVALLKHHPWYSDQSQWPQKLADVSPESEGITLFMLAATWPDDIKIIKTPYEKHENWHFVDNPYIKPGSSVKRKRAASPNAFDAYQWATNQLQSSTATDSAKATALAWMLHIIGDIHQPLHNAEMYSDDLPNGDIGGNLLCVAGNSQHTNLHAFWDDLLGPSSLTFNDCKAKARQLLDSFPENSLHELTKNKIISEWSTMESFPTAEESAYLNGNISYSILGSDAKECSSGPELSSDYISHAQSIANRRIALAGLRVRDYIIANVK